MTAQTSNCDHDRLRQLLDGKLASKQVTEVARHVESCAECRRQLESFAADDDWWQGTRNALSGMTERGSFDPLSESVDAGELLTDERRRSSQMDDHRASDIPILNPTSDANEPAVPATSPACG